MQYPVAPSPPETAVGNALPAVKLSAADYLAWEQAQAMRHEFWDGEIFAMAGAEERHVATSLNVAMALRQHLRGSACRARRPTTRPAVPRRAEPAALDQPPARGASTISRMRRRSARSRRCSAA